MPLENFYQKSDRTAQRRNGRIVLAFIASAAYLLFGWALLADYLDRRAIREAEDEQINSLYAFCNGLPKPESFVLVRRDRPILHETFSSVVYHYRSDRPLDELTRDFSRALDPKSWQRIADKNSFRRDHQSILISRSDQPDADYSLYCYKETLSFGIYD